MFMEQVWKSCEVCVEELWNVYGMCMECLWNVYGMFMVYATVMNYWNVDGTVKRTMCGI